MNVAKTVCVYSESKEKVDFKKIGSFVKSNFGFVFKIIRLQKGVTQTKGLLFDPVNTQRFFEKISLKKNAVEILLTDKLIATYEDVDRRLHLRAAIYGYPSVISTAGIVEAPAKPKGYYLAKQKYSLLKAWELKQEEVKREFRGRFIDYSDIRITEVLKGYIAQAIFFNLIGEPFCEKKTCRLFNAHWQEDLIRAQIKPGKFCTMHKKALMKIATTAGME